MNQEMILPGVMAARNPQKTMHFSKGRIDVFDIDGRIVTRLTLEPGWRWSCHKPPDGMDEFPFSNFQHQISGTLRCRMPGGVEVESKSGDISYLAFGYDAWVVGDEPVAAVD